MMFRFFIPPKGFRKKWSKALTTLPPLKPTAQTWGLRGMIRASGNKWLSQGRASQALKYCPCIGITHVLEYQTITPPQRQPPKPLEFSVPLPCLCA